MSSSKNSNKIEHRSWFNVPRVDFPIDNITDSFQNCLKGISVTEVIKGVWQQ